ncbi:MAG TPA: Ig-like domain repeat protein [Candidatus Eisenbacteria bacterium]
MIPSILSPARTSAPVRFALVLLLLLIGSMTGTAKLAFAQAGTSTVSATSPGTFVTTVAPTVGVPVTLSRSVTTPMLGFSVNLTLSGLTTSTSAITEGGFLAASGSSTSFHVTDNGGGTFTVDGVTLGSPCGSGATSGTLFTVAVGSTLTGGSGSVTINSVTLRDCSNATLPSVIGTTATVNVDRTTPSVAVTSPNGGESWLQGSVHAITWTATDPEGIAAGGITLEYSVDNGSSWLPVASGLANSGTFNWTIPNNPSATARVRVTALDVHGNPATDASDAASTLQATTTASLASTPNPSVTGQSVTLTATVAPAAASGSVEFFDGATSLGTATLSGGTASIATAALATGSHSLTVVYAGSVLYAGSTSAASTQTVNKASTSTSLASSPNPSLVGQSVALTASVTVTAPGAGSPGGSVEFFDGGTSLGTVAVSAGSAVLNTSSLAPGARSLTAVYSGNTSFSTSTSAAHVQTVNQAATTTALASTPNPSLSGQSIALTATVAVTAPGSGTATGSVQFFDGATSLGIASLSSGTASLNTAALAVGSHSLTAVYLGDASFTGSTSSAVSQVVNQAATTTAVSNTPNPSLAGQSVAITATVAVTAPGSGTATGSVQFFDGASPLGTVSLSGGSATLNTSSLAVGSHSLTAVYAGSTSFTGSTSAASTQTVNKASTSTSLASAPNPSSFGQSVALTATVAAIAPGSGTATGNVQFFDGVTSLGIVALSGGSAVLNTSTLAVGTHSLTAVYAGDGSFTGSTSSAQSQSVTAAASTTSLATTPNPSVAGQSVALTATVTPSGTTGSVQFFDGVTSLGIASLSGGTASLNTSALAVGTHSLTAVYAGDGSFTGSTSSAVSQVVNQAATTTAVSNTPNPSLAGQSVAITATVAVTAPGSGTATGSVQFFDGASPLGIVSLAAGSATLNTSSLAVGSHSLTAVYAGSTSFTGSTSAASTQTVNKASTSTSLASAPNPSSFGQSVAVTATVAAIAPGAGTATGSVEFFDGVTSLGIVALSGGSAVLNTSALTVGTHPLTAVYAGDGSFTGSTSSAQNHTVTTSGSATSLATTPNPSVAGQSVALTASVTPSGTTGSVQFFDGVTSLGSASLSGGTASLNTSALAVGTHSLTAVYSGDAGHTGSTSAAVSQVVNQAATTTAVSNTPNPSVAGQSVAITATVAVTAPGSGTATGSVQFFDGASPLGTVSLAAGSATLNTSSLAVGSHSLTAVYAGSTSFTGSTSAASTQTVNKASTSTSLASAPNPSSFGQSVALTATVAAIAPGSGTATGSVEFFDGVTSLGIVALSGGSAVLNTSALAVGTHSLTAVYAGDGSFTGSTSSASSQVVNQAASTTSVASSLNPSTFGQTVTFTATVTPSGATGSVQIFDGATPLGTASLVAGSAAVSTSALGAGSHAITAVYSGDASRSGSTSSVLTQVVNAAGTAVSLVASPNPGVFLDPETLTATVTPSDASGSVQFFDGSTSLGTAPVSSGTATLVTSSLAVGVHSLTASYPGDANHSGATSSAVSLEIRAKIVATAGANGSITPSGTVLVSLGATPSFAFAADPGFHVASVTVDGAGAPLTSPFTFAPVSANHTIDVQFVVNPAVAAITTLASTQLRTGNDGDGTTKIALTWSAVPAGSTVEVWRKGYGNYPEYDDGPSPGSVPATPGAYPPAGWTLTGVVHPGDTDEPTTRDFWYYVAYVHDTFGTVSPVSNQTSGALNYHLGDVSDLTTVGVGDNQVTTSDLSALGMHYGLTGAAVAPFNFLDVGPTTDLSVTARPTTDDKINFEDLVMFALNYFPVASAPQAQARPAAAATDGVTLSAPVHVAAGDDVAVRLMFSGTGRMMALSVRLAWDPAVVEPVSYTAGDAVLAQGGLVLSSEPGSVDGAAFTGSGQGLVGEGEFATVHFRVLAPGDPRVGFAGVDARDVQNHAIQINSGVLAVAPKAWTTAFAPAMPNPFGRTTTFQYSLARSGPAELDVFSVDGRRVRTLASGVREAGEYRVEWNGTDDSGRPLAAGVYYARLRTAQARFTRVVTYLK